MHSCGSARERGPVQHWAVDCVGRKMCAHLVHERDQGQGVWMAVAADTEEERAHEKATPGALQIKTSWWVRVPLTQPRRAHLMSRVLSMRSHS